MTTETFWTKKNIIRFVLFLVAVVVAVTAFSNAFTGKGQYAEGWYEIDLTAETQPVLYDSGMKLLYYAEGSEAEVKSRLKTVSELYSEALLAIYERLDSDTTYDDCVNIASVNEGKNAPVQVDQTLFDILCEAKRLDEANDSYNMLAGALYREWQTLLYLEEPSEFDPLNNEDEAQRISDIAQMVNSDAVSFEIVDEKERLVRLNVSEEYWKFARENEVKAPVLDLNQLKNAFMAEAVADSLTQAGITKAVISFADGMTLNVETGEGSVPMSVEAPEGVKYGFYVVEKDGKKVYRNDRFDVRTGESGDAVSMCIVTGTAKLHDMALDVQTAASLKMNEVDDFIREIGKKKDETMAVTLLTE